jgi:hypothetical protein
MMSFLPETLMHIWKLYLQQAQPQEEIRAHTSQAQLIALLSPHWLLGLQLLRLPSGCSEKSLVTSAQLTHSPAKVHLFSHRHGGDSGRQGRKTRLEKSLLSSPVALEKSKFQFLK